MNTNSFKHIGTLFLILIIAVSISSCSKKTSIPTSTDVSKNNSAKYDIPAEVATEVFDKAPITDVGVPTFGDEEDCHGVRKGIRDLEDEIGYIMVSGSFYLITTDEGAKRYNPCDLPENLKVDGAKVRFSGKVLEIFMNERLVGTPFRLKSVRAAD